MSSTTAIEWTRSDDGSRGATWNPVTGCTKVSPGCAHCYAERFAERWRGIPGHPYEQGFDLRLWPERLRLPLTWRRPRRIFVNSMSDLFHEEVPVEFVQRVFEVIAEARWHTFQVLTKRAERLLELAPSLPWPPNVWMGVTIENRRYIRRADALRQVPAEIRFISAEPLLGPLTDLELTGIDWLIVGGESGPGARPMHPDWARELRDRAEARGVAFFFKQWGAWAPASWPEAIVDAEPRQPGTPRVNPVFMGRVGKSAAGRVLDGRTWDGFPWAVANLSGSEGGQT
ncbi:MAG: phage Gp37/Gp68 family protein [Candidatus Dormibacteraeota bacterium]|nr:phage Gp37/Gp68 family protein [Candidatus Dormibacteraeota bacterium]